MCARVVTLIVMLSATPLFASSSPPDRLAVRVHLEFDPSIESSTIRKVAQREAADIWERYGIDLQWTDRGGRPDLSLDAVVERDHVDPDAALVLGHTRVSVGASAQAPIHISFDAVDSLLRSQRGRASMPLEREIGVALGRVLAHEVGHILLGSPAYHDPDGLMRTTFLPADLMWGPPVSFRLTTRSVGRLRDRMASLALPRLPETFATASWVAWGAAQPDIR